MIVRENMGQPQGLPVRDCLALLEEIRGNRKDCSVRPPNSNPHDSDFFNLILTAPE